MPTSSRPAAGPICLLALGFLLLGAGPARAARPVAAPVPEARLLVIGLPEAQARDFVLQEGAPVGLGVFPDSRNPARFLREVSFGAPAGRDGVRSPLHGRRGNLGLALARGGIVAGSIEGGPPRIRNPLVDAFFVDPAELARLTTARPLRTDAVVLALATASDAARVAAGHEGPLLILGVGRRTPLLVGLCRTSCLASSAGPRSRLLDGGIARRPGIVTPYDLAATVLDVLGVKRPAEGFIGKPLRTRPSRDSAAEIDAIAARLRRDASYAPALTIITVSIALPAVTIGLLLSIAGSGPRRRLGQRLVQAGALTPAGYIPALFIPSGRSEVRAAALALAFVAGFAHPPPDRDRIPRIWVVAAATLAILALAGPLRPGGEPALSLWGDPLVSWRFFGLQNFEAAFIAAGVAVWATLANVPWRALGAAVVLAAAVIGLPQIGANFVGVLTFAFGATLTLFGLVRRRFAWWHAVVAAAVAAAAFTAALLADAGSPVSHGGQAVRTVARGGIRAAEDFMRIRLRLNYNLVRDFPGGFLVAAAVIAFTAGLLWWATRPGEPVRERAAVLGGAAMGLAALILEDSGFLVGTLLWFLTAAAWALVTVSRGGLGRAASPDGR
jgi:hypothetical protein